MKLRVIVRYSQLCLNYVQKLDLRILIMSKIVLKLNWTLLIRYLIFGGISNLDFIILDLLVQNCLHFPILINIAWFLSRNQQSMFQSLNIFEIATHGTSSNSSNCKGLMIWTLESCNWKTAEICISLQIYGLTHLNVMMAHKMLILWRILIS